MSTSLQAHLPPPFPQIQAFSSLGFPGSVNGSFSSGGIKLPAPFTHLPWVSPLFPCLVSAASPSVSIFPLASPFSLAHCLITLVQTRDSFPAGPLPSTPPFAVPLCRRWIKPYEAEFRACHRFIKTNTEADTALPDIHDLPRLSPPTSFPTPCPPCLFQPETPCLHPVTWPGPPTSDLDYSLTFSSSFSPM